MPRSVQCDFYASLMEVAWKLDREVLYILLFLSGTAGCFGGDLPGVKGST